MVLSVLLLLHLATGAAVSDCGIAAMVIGLFINGHVGTCVAPDSVLAASGDERTNMMV